MSDKIEDLWPELIPAAIVTPKSILKTQVTALEQKSNGLLHGQVETWTNGDRIYHRFYLVVPALENYRYSLLRIHHSASAYPVSVDESPIREEADFIRPWPMLPDESSFRNWLRNVFSSDETKRVLESLLAQATV
jgi:hypothetical protein